MIVGIRKAPKIDENCDVCEKSLASNPNIEIETIGYLLRLCQECARKVGTAA